jgi:hypothetical protein
MDESPLLQMPSDHGHTRPRGLLPNNGPTPPR